LNTGGINSADMETDDNTSDVNSDNSFNAQQSPDNVQENHQNSFNAEQDKNGAVVSNNLKIEQTKKLVDRWLQSPIIGFGYGSYIPGYYRSQTQLFLYEMTAFALLMKLGIVGILSWLLLFVSATILVVKSNKNALFNIFLWFAVSIAFLITIQTNPLLFSANSINLIIFLILFGVDSSSKDKMRRC
jgi:uncharacterized membrane protein YhaH (DUF805 family)